MKLSETEAGINWIKQFPESEQYLAISLIDSLTRVTRDEFCQDLISLIAQCAKDADGPIGLYAERELHGNPLYKEQALHDGKSKRAVGKGPKLLKNPSSEVGSEGIVSNIITSLCRQDKSKFLNHPGPDEIRSKKVRKFYLISDLIGSGKRCYDYLQSAWRVKSVKSWRSMKLLSFTVIAYAATQQGEKSVKSHPCAPLVNYVKPCPTIDSEFDSEYAYKMKGFCMRNDPHGKPTLGSVGFKGTGALIIFPHGCPNNAPLLLHKIVEGSRIEPLFREGVTFDIGHAFVGQDRIGALKMQLANIKEGELAKGEWVFQTNETGRALILFLAATKRRSYNEQAVALRTKFSVPEVRILNKHALDLGLVNQEGRLTEIGYRMLRKARSLKEPRETIADNSDYMYYPKSLRAPRGDSS